MASHDEAERPVGGGNQSIGRLRATYLEQTAAERFKRQLRLSQFASKLARARRVPR
jgi:hypothetical protein